MEGQHTHTHTPYRKRTLKTQLLKQKESQKRIGSPILQMSVFLDIWKNVNFDNFEDSLF